MKRLSVLLAAVFVLSLLVGLAQPVQSWDECNPPPCPGTNPMCLVTYCCENPHDDCQEQSLPVKKTWLAGAEGTPCTPCRTLWVCSSECDPE